VSAPTRLRTTLVWLYIVAAFAFTAVMVAMYGDGARDLAGPMADVTVLWNLYGAAEWESLKATGNDLWADRVAILLFLIWFRLDRIVALLKQIAAKD
jgi:hypothetical protein